MNFDFKTTADFFDYFKDEKSCYEYLEKERWNNEICCPHCGSMKTPYKIKPRYGKHKNIPAYRCSENECGLLFTAKTKTIFEGTKVELRKWFHTIYEINVSKKGISSTKLSELIGVSQKTCWLMLHKIRNTQKQDEEPFEGTNQIDETFVGGKNKNRHHDKKIQQSQGRSFKDKTPVLGIVNEETGKVKLFVVRDTSGATIKPILLKSIKQGSTVLTDEWTAYSGLEPYYNHYICDHSKGQYTNGFATTNRCENFWSIFKRGIIGIYHFVSRRHLKLYCNEFAMRYNNRSQDLINKFINSIKLSLQPRITYALLTYPIAKRLW